MEKGNGIKKTGNNSRRTQQIERREEFPVECLVHLESKLGKMRKLLMNVAAEIAAQSSPNTKVYRVKRTHIDQATVKLFRDISIYKKDLDLCGQI